MARIKSAIRKLVRQRANERCEYCCKPEQYTYENYEVDHITAQRHRGSDDAENLAWTCTRCNRSKGTDIAGIDSETSALTLLYNPRTQNWDEHFKIEEGVIIGRTPAGRVTVELLMMNHPEQVELRKLLIEAELW